MIWYELFIPLLYAVILCYSWDSILSVTATTTVSHIEEASYEFNFNLHSHPDLDICNETVRCMMLKKGNLDEDFLRYFIFKLGAVMVNVKKNIYSTMDRRNYTSSNPADNYEYFTQTGRIIANKINDWYLYVMNIVKLNTLADHRFEFLGTLDYAKVTNRKKLHQLWAMEVAYKDDLLKLGWRLKNRIRLQLLRLSHHYFYHSKGEILNYENLTYSMEKQELLYEE